MTFQDLITQIKIEARVLQDDTFDAVTINLLNEFFKEAVQSEHPFELRDEVEIEIEESTGFVSLPADFLIHHQINFIDFESMRKYPLTDQDEAAPPAPPGLYGHPKTFELLADSKLLIKPISEISSDDRIELIYYKAPLFITTANLDVPNPLQRLEPYLTRSVVRRIRMLHVDDVQIAQMLQQDITSAAKSYSQDEPIPAERPD